MLTTTSWSELEDRAASKKKVLRKKGRSVGEILEGKGKRKKEKIVTSVSCTR